MTRKIKSRSESGFPAILLPRYVQKINCGKNLCFTDLFGIISRVSWAKEIIILAGLLLAVNIPAQTPYYHINRSFSSVQFDLQGIPTEYQLNEEADKLTDIINGSIQLNSNETYAIEKQVALPICYGSAEGAWNAVSNYPGSTSNYPDKLFDNVGWVRGTKSANGGWGAYLWVLQNKITFQASTSAWWSTTNGIPVAISNVMVGSLGDYQATSNVVDISPVIPSNFPGANYNDFGTYQVDITNVYYELIIPDIWITPRYAVAGVGSSTTIQYAVAGTNIPEGVTWEIIPEGITSGAVIQASNDWHYAGVTPENVATNYKIRATSVDNTNFYDEVNLNVIKIDIWETNIYVGVSNTVSLRLTPDSTLDAQWEIKPVLTNGASIEGASSGISIVINAGGVPTNYIVKAYATDLTNCFDTCTVTVVMVDLLVDTDRNGTIDDDDEDGKDTFTQERGAVILVNSDDDGNTGSPDFANDHVDGQADFQELAKLRVQRLGISEMPDGCRVIMRIDNSATNHVRVFTGYFANSLELLGPGAGSNEGNKKICVLSNSWVTGTGNCDFGVEALKYMDNNSWEGGSSIFDGKINIALVFQQNDGAGWNDICSDEIRLQAAPLILAWNGQTVEKIYATDSIASQISALTSIPVTNIGASFKWPQDCMEIANSVGSERMPVIVDLKYGSATSLPEDLENNDRQYGYVLIDNNGEGGDAEVTWPCGEQWPIGRIIFGDKTYPYLQYFVRAQNVQAISNTYGLLFIRTDWLLIGHVDEILSFVPSTDHAVFVASPKLAIDKVHQLFTGGNGNATIKVSQSSSNTVVDILVRKEGSSYMSNSLADSVDETCTNFLIQTNTFTALSSLPAYLRIDDEYVKCVTATGNTITVERGQWVTNGIGVEASEHSADTIIYCLSDLVKENLETFHNGKPGPQLEISNMRTLLSVRLSPVVPHFIELPIIFFRPYPSGENADRWTAYTANVVNCLVVDGMAIMNDPMGPTVNNVDQFKDLISSQIDGILSPNYIDAWELQDSHGAVHCGSNTKRQPISGIDWWSAWQGQ